MSTSADYLSSLSDRFKLGRLGFSVREDENSCKLMSELLEELFTEPGGVGLWTTYLKVVVM